MSGSVVLSDLVTRVRRKANMENTTFCTDAEIQEYLEQYFGELYDMIIEGDGGHHYIVTSLDQSTVAGTETYQITNGQDPDPIYKVLGVDVKWNNEWRKVEQLHPAHWNDLEDSVGWTHWTDVRYHWLTLLTAAAPNVFDDPAPGRIVRFHPTPQAVHTFRVRYLPYPNDFSSGASTDAFQGFSGWDKYAVLGAAADCADKEESFDLADRLRAQMQQQAERILWHSKTMNEDGQNRVRDVYEDGPPRRPRRALS